MTRTIAVVGASGVQGSSIVRVMSKVPGWKVRAITRNPTKKRASIPVGDNTKVWEADIDDEASLDGAFKGVHAIFALTDWWAHIQAGRTPEDAAQLQENQGMKIARAAARVDTLENYLWSTLPNPGFGGEPGYRPRLPHFTQKAIVDARIKMELPLLARKTTYLIFGYYPQLIVMAPLAQPILKKGVPANSALSNASLPVTRYREQTRLTIIQNRTDDKVLLVPSLPGGKKPDAGILLSGDMDVNPGIWVRQILAASPDLVHESYVHVGLEMCTYEELLDVWREMTGYDIERVPPEYFAFASRWSYSYWYVVGEFARQIGLLEVGDPWEADNDNYVTAKQLDIQEREVGGFRTAMIKFKMRRACHLDDLRLWKIDPVRGN